jgi:hypothetical protein
VWIGVTWSLLLTKTGAWRSRLSSGCVFGITLGWSSKFTIWGCGKQEPWSMSPIAFVFFGVPPKMLWSFSYHVQEGGGALVALHVSYSSWYFFLILVILFWHYFQVRDTSLRNATLILSTNSFQSFATIGCLRYSQCFSSHKSIII